MDQTQKTMKSQHGGSSGYRSSLRPISGSKYNSRQLNSIVSRRNISSVMTKSDKSTTSTKPHQIFNENNVDVTPLPLLDTSFGKRNNIVGENDTATPTDIPSFAAMTGSSFTGGPFTRSVFNTTVIYEPEEELSGPDVSSSWGVILQKTDAEKVLTDDDLEKEVEILLEETDTDVVFELVSTCVLEDTEEAEVTKKTNESYKALVKNRVGNDRYVSKGMNTFNDPKKLKLVQTNLIKYEEVGVMASNWDMYDSYREKNNIVTEAEVDEDDLFGKVISSEDKSVKGAEKPVSLASSEQGKSKIEDNAFKSTMFSSISSSLSSQSKVVKLIGSVTAEEADKSDEKILQNESFQKDLFVMERIINLNTYQPKQAMYRNLPVSFDIDKNIEETVPISQLADENMAPNLLKLWSFSCPLTKGHTVSCMTWNKSNPDLIAVGYGQFEFKHQKPGLACCWSLKNPEYPEKVFQRPSGVTALDFSTSHSNLLAVGFYDGGLAVYDMKIKSEKPILTNFLSSNKHTAPVCQVKWIEKDSGSDVTEKMEILISISKDGRVTSWSIRKGFESNDMMRLHRVGRGTKVGGKAREKKVETFISRDASGMSFAFQPESSNIYLVGTEDGQIHKCSCSYNEQYLDTYTAHTAPVYSIVWSPFLPDVFLSCGGDWTVRLWHQDRLTPILTFYSSIILESKSNAASTDKLLQQTTSERTVYRLKSVYAVEWSPKSSTMFACVNHEGVEVWDLSQNILDPIIHYPPMDSPPIPAPTSVTFATNSECILVGDTEGNVTVLQLKCMPPPPSSDKQRHTLIQVLNSSLASQLNSTSDERQIFFKSDNYPQSS